MVPTPAVILRASHELNRAIALWLGSCSATVTGAWALRTSMCGFGWCWKSFDMSAWSHCVRNGTGIPDPKVRRYPSADGIRGAAGPGRR